MGDDDALAYSTHAVGVGRRTRAMADQGSTTNPNPAAGTADSYSSSKKEPYATHAAKVQEPVPMARLHLQGVYTDPRPWDGGTMTSDAARNPSSLAVGPSGGAGVLGGASADAAAAVADDTPLVSDAAAGEALLGACVRPPAA